MSQHFLVAYLCTEGGLSLSAAGLYSSLTFAISLVGKTAAGFALDRPNQRLYAIAGCILLALGSALLVRPTWVADAAGAANFRLAPATSHWQLVAFSCAYGLGYGATFTLIQARAAQLYGARADFPALQSCLAVGQYVGSFLGVLITSQMRGASGTYVLPFAIFPFLGAAIAVLCVSLFRPPRRAQHHARGDGQEERGVVLATSSAPPPAAMVPPL